MKDGSEVIVVGVAETGKVMLITKEKRKKRKEKKRKEGGRGNQEEQSGQRKSYLMRRKDLLRGQGREGAR